MRRSKLLQKLGTQIKSSEDGNTAYDPRSVKAFVKKTLHAFEKSEWKIFQIWRKNDSKKNGTDNILLLDEPNHKMNY